MVRWFSRLRYAWRRHGPVSFIRLAAYNVVYHALGRKFSIDRSVPLDALDAKYGTETDGIREIGSLDAAASATALHANRYEPSGSQLARTAIDKLNIDHTRFTFIDFGSGKGRVLLVAAGFPFKEIIGIEFSRELHETAVQNIARLPPDVVRAGAIRSSHGDAASFEPPKSDLVCYLYNPFGLAVTARVADRLVAHHERHGCRVILIYVDPRHRQAFERTEKFVILSETPQVLTLTTLPAAGAGAADRP